jgi:recombination protein RecR
MFLSDDLQQLIQTFCKWSGTRPRSARRVVLHFLKNKHLFVNPLNTNLPTGADHHHECSVCGYIDGRNPCFFCISPYRDPSVFCIVTDAADVCSFEKGCFFKGKHHVLGGMISAFYRKHPKDLNLSSLRNRLSQVVKEVIVALDGTLDGQSPLNYMLFSMQ